MRPQRFQHLYLQIGDTIKFEAEERDITRALGIPDLSFESLSELSYRDQQGLALAFNYRAYNMLLAHGGSDTDGFVYLEMLQATATEEALAFLDRRHDVVKEQIHAHELANTTHPGA